MTTANPTTARSAPQRAYWERWQSEQRERKAQEAREALERDGQLELLVGLGPKPAHEEPEREALARCFD